MQSPAGEEPTTSSSASLGASSSLGIENGISSVQFSLVVKNLPASAGDIKDMGLIPGLGRSFGEGIGYTPVFLGFPGGSAGKESSCNVGPK